MKKISEIIVVTLFITLSGISIAAAEENVALKTCEFREGKDMDDFDRWSNKWNAWKDTGGRIQNRAYYMTPIYHSSEVTFDVGFMDMWGTGAQMAADTIDRLTNGSKLYDEFDKIVDCDTHQNFGALAIKGEKAAVSDGPVEFNSCTVNEEIPLPEAIAAIREWTDYKTKTGSDAARYLLFPIYGENSEDKYDFVYLKAYPSFESFGLAYDRFSPNRSGDGYALYKKATDRFSTDAGYEVYQNTIGRVMSCHHTGVYRMKLIRKEPPWPGEEQ